jgi:hypothetical protein
LLPGGGVEGPEQGRKKGNTVSDFKTGDLHEHGYHVTGIIAANFEGDTTDEGRITGMAGGGIVLSAQWRIEYRRCVSSTPCQ